MGRRTALGMGGRGSRELLRLRRSAGRAESVRYTDRSYGPIAQLVERMAGSHEVRGSNPLGSTPGNRPNPRGGELQTVYLRGRGMAVAGPLDELSVQGLA